MAGTQSSVESLPLGLSPTLRTLFVLSEEDHEDRRRPCKTIDEVCRRVSHGIAFEGTLLDTDIRETYRRCWSSRVWFEDFGQNPRARADIANHSLVAALWMSRCGIKTLIIDKRDAETRSGQGDGVQARTLEILDSFGLADAVWNESYHMGEMCMWV